ncbi:MAG TPA: hypothetical protein PK867_11355, partial [Pirellulales bacterium]|nr:hypothetical protein [Pirellulales bacterium]
RMNAKQNVGWDQRARERRATMSEAPGGNEASGVRRRESGADDAARKLELRDLSALARVVIKGPAAADLLKQQGIGVPERIYQFRSLADDGLVVRTGATEFFVEDSWQSSAVGRLREASKAHVPGVLPVWRQDLSLLISGSEATTLLAQ